MRRPIAEVLASDGTSAGALAAADDFRDSILSIDSDVTRDAYRVRCVKQGDLVAQGEANGTILKGKKVYAGLNGAFPCVHPTCGKSFSTWGAIVGSGLESWPKSASALRLEPTNFST
jgi:hypothetical protein